MLVALVYLPFLAIKSLFRRLAGFARPAARAAGTSLDQVLFNWTKLDAFTLRDLHQSLCVFGQTGSGKSSGALLLLSRACIRLRGSGGLILASKPEDKEFFLKRFAEQGRSDDLIVFDSSGKFKFNFTDFIMKSGGDAREITQFLTTVAEALGGAQGKGDDPFWAQSQQRLIFSAVQPVMLATGTVEIPALQQFISTAAQHPTVFSDPEQYAKWKLLPHNQIMAQADAKEKSPIEKFDFAAAVAYWTDEYPRFDNKPRSSILAGVMNTLHTLNMGIVRDLVSTTTNVTPADMERGKWVLVDLPIDRFGESGKIIMHGFKYLTQRFILQRHVQGDAATIVIMADEAQDIVSSFDSQFLAKCRSHYGCSIYLTQSLHSYMGAAMGHAAEHKAKALLTNFRYKIAHTIGDAESATYLCSLLGKRLEGMTSYNQEGGGSLTESYQDTLQPVELLTGLRSHGGEVDAVIIRSGVGFSTGHNFLRVTMSQT